MDYFTKLGKPETDPLRLELAQQQQVCVKAVAARDAVSRFEQPEEYADLEAQVRAAYRVQTALREQLVARPYVSAMNEPDAAKPVEDLVEDED